MILAEGETCGDCPLRSYMNGQRQDYYKCLLLDAGLGGYRDGAPRCDRCKERWPNGMKIVPIDENE